MLKPRIIIISLVIIVSGFLVGAGVVFYRTTAVGILPYGGFITTSLPCTCSGGFLLTVGPPSAAQFVWYPGTPQSMYNQLPRAGVWTLGYYTPGAVCTIYVGKGCAPLGKPIGTIGTGAGTSL